MGRKMDVMMYCSKSKKQYKTTFEEFEEEKWWGISMEKIVKPSFFDKLFLKATPNKTEHNQETLSSDTNETTNIRGAFYIGKHECPYCGNTSWASCGKCREWSCLKEGEKKFYCAVCGETGVIEGMIDSATGVVEKSNASNNALSRHEKGKTLR